MFFNFQLFNKVLYFNIYVKRNKIYLKLRLEINVYNNNSFIIEFIIITCKIKNFV